MNDWEIWLKIFCASLTGLRQSCGTNNPQDIVAVADEDARLGVKACNKFYDEDNE